jgi:rod shape-determining protein MreC
MNSDKLLPFTELRDENDEVAVGDPVVTSYVSDQYQEGLLIGYIYSIEDNPNNLTKSGTIAPVVDFLHLQEVLVITDMKNTGDTDLAEDTETQSTETQSTETESGE